MRKIKEYIGIGLLCASVALASCESNDEEQKVIFDKDTNQSYYIAEDRELRGESNEIIQPYKDNGVIRCSSYPGEWMRTRIYDSGKRIEIAFFNELGAETSSIDELIDSEKVKEHRTRFERDRELLRQAGLIK